MAVRRSKFAPPTQMPRGVTRSREEIIPRFYGMRTSAAPQNLLRGEASYMENLVLEGGVLKMRPPLVYVSDTTLPEAVAVGSVPHQYAQGSAVDGTLWHIVTSTSSAEAAVASDPISQWTQLNSNLSVVRDSSSVVSAHAWDVVFNSTAQENVVVFTDSATPPYYKALDATSAWTSIPDFASVESTADLVASFDDRLIFANTVNTSEGTVSNRLRWSVRGSPLDFTSVGAGFEDLKELPGPIIKLVKKEGYILIFSPGSVWIGKPRRDAYAFDFDVLVTMPGEPIAGTICDTPAGVMWLDTSYNLHRLVGSTVRTFSPDVREFLRRSYNGVPYAQYDDINRHYMLFFYEDTSKHYAFFINVDEVRQDPSMPTMDKADWTLQNFRSSLITHKQGETAGHRNIFLAKSFGTTVSSPVVKYQPLVHLYRDNNLSVGAGFEIAYDVATNQMGWTWYSHGLRGAKDTTQMEAIEGVQLDYSYPLATGAENIYVKLASTTTTQLGTTNAYGLNPTSITTASLDGKINMLSNVTSSESYMLEVYNSTWAPMTPVAGRYPRLTVWHEGEDYVPSAPIAIHAMRIDLRPFSGRRI